jgi:hypothetical protein
VVVVSDLQIPYHDLKAVNSLLAFLEDFEPDVLVNVGDDIDSPQTSHWSKGAAGEYADTLQRDIDETKTIHTRFRAAVGGAEYHVSRSNHGDRTQKYINQYAPALRSLRCLQLPELLGYDLLGIQYHREPFTIAPGWVCAHGDEGTLSSIAGRTAGLLAEKWGTSLVCGHTHRAGVSSKSYGWGGDVKRIVTGMEVGHLMQANLAGYLSGGYCDWQQAFGILYVSSSGDVAPVLVPVRYGQFMVEGVTYGNYFTEIGFDPSGDVAAPQFDTENSAKASTVLRRSFT